MAAITWDDVTAGAPALSSVDADEQTLILAYVNDLLDVTVFYGGEDGSVVKLLRVYLARHFAVGGTLGGSGAAGPVISESAGGLSRTYAQQSASSLSGADDLDMTAWGRMARGIIRRSPARAGIVL